MVLDRADFIQLGSFDIGTDSGFQEQRIGVGDDMSCTDAVPKFMHDRVAHLEMP